MGKANGHVKRHKSFKHHVDRKRMWKKSKQLPTINCAEIKAAWNPKKTVDGNMRAMGLTLDANKTLKIDDTKVRMVPKPETTVQKDASGDTVMAGPSVADLLEKEAAIPMVSNMKLSEPEAQFCITMIEKHASDYKAMAKDAGNYYQETPKQIRRKIEKFIKFPGSHGDFLKKKGLLSAPNMDTD